MLKSKTNVEDVMWVLISIRDFMYSLKTLHGNDASSGFRGSRGRIQRWTLLIKVTKKFKK